MHNTVRHSQRRNPLHALPDNMDTPKDESAFLYRRDGIVFWVGEIPKPFANGSADRP